MSARALLLSEAKPELLTPEQWQILNALFYEAALKAAKLRVKEQYEAAQRQKR